jgi:hypothetical protein
MTDGYDMDMDSDGIESGGMDSDFDIDFDIDTSMDWDLNDWDADDSYDSWSDYDGSDDSDGDGESENDDDDTEITEVPNYVLAGPEHDNLESEEEEDKQHFGGNTSGRDEVSYDNKKEEKRPRSLFDWLFGAFFD